jgi:hypothetical protein
MVRRASVLLGLAVLLSLLFPARALLAQSGIAAPDLSLPVLDLAAVCALAAVLPSMLLFRDAQLRHRIPRWNAWVGLLALSSVLFLLLHVSWSHDLFAAWLREALAPGGSLPLAVAPTEALHGIELATRLGVLVSFLAVLVNLDAPPDPDAPVRVRRSRA